MNIPRETVIYNYKIVSLTGGIVNSLSAVTVSAGSQDNFNVPLFPFTLMVALFNPHPGILQLFSACFSSAADS